jgi:hypothetical protein
VFNALDNAGTRETGIFDVPSFIIERKFGRLNPAIFAICICVYLLLFNRFDRYLLERFSVAVSDIVISGV